MRPPTSPPSASLEERVASDLSFIRAAMERSAHFTAVPGWGGVYMGAVALVAATLSLAPGWPVTNAHWPVVWGVAAVVASAGNAWCLVRKARRQGQSVLRGRGPTFLVGLCAPLFVGAVLSVLLWRAGHVGFLPETWLLLYGTAVLSGGAASLPVVRLVGAGFLALGSVAAFGPDAWGLPLLALGFGGLHLLFGTWIGVRHGG